MIRPIQIGRLIGLLAICLAGAARIANAQPCDAATAEASSGGACWTTPAGMPQGTRFSTLTDITPANVGTLVEEFATPLGMIGSQQGGPLVVGSTMYVVTPYPNRLVAIDLNSPGTVLWTFDPGESAFAIGVACCDGVNRGAAYSAGLVVYATLDDTVVAVNAATGALAWRARVGNPQTGETLTAAPLIVNGKVIVGNAGSEFGVRGWVQALDLATGKPIWKAYATGPDADVLIDSRFAPYYAKDQGTDLGASTWPGKSAPPNRASWLQGGATAWGWLTYDPALNLLFYGTGNPGAWDPDMRPGDNKWSSTIFARSPDDGHAVWAYQLVPHDRWDFDAVNESIVANLPINGKPRDVIVHFNKNGFAYAIERSNGRVLRADMFGHAAGSVTWASGIDLATGLPQVNPAMESAEAVLTQGICPSFFGVKDWEPAAYSPVTRLFYLPTINFCVNLEPLKAFYIAGSPFWGASFEVVPGPDGTGPGAFLGELAAWDAGTGIRKWSVHEPLPLYGGALATAGGLVFYGTVDKHFKALDATSGAVLFDTSLECGMISNPISYNAPDGKQRIAVTTGVGWFASRYMLGTMCPAGFGATQPTATNGYVHVFKLP